MYYFRTGTFSINDFLSIYLYTVQNSLSCFVCVLCIFTRPFCIEWSRQLLWKMQFSCFTSVCGAVVSKRSIAQGVSVVILLELLRCLLLNCSLCIAPFDLAKQPRPVQRSFGGVDVVLTFHKRKVSRHGVTQQQSYRNTLTSTQMIFES